MFLAADDSFLLVLGFFALVVVVVVVVAVVVVVIVVVVVVVVLLFQQQFCLESQKMIDNVDEKCRHATFDKLSPDVLKKLFPLFPSLSLID